MHPGCAGHLLSRRTALELVRAGLVVLLAARNSAPVAAEESSSSARHREIVHQLFASGVNTGNEALIAALYAPSVTRNGVDTPATVAAADMPITLDDFRQALPDVRASVDALVAEGDLVAALITWRGPHPPAGTHIEGTTMHLFRIEHERIAEQRSVGWDWLEERGLRRLCNPANPLVTP